MITLVDYGLGNIQAFAHIYQRLNIPVAVAHTTDQLAAAERIILPGVGSFDWAMTRLEESGLRACLDDLVMSRKRPVLGVCVGMQMMARRSDEGKLPGLGWIEGEVKKLSLLPCKSTTAIENKLIHHEEHEEHEVESKNQSPLRVLRELRGGNSGLRAQPALEEQRITDGKVVLPHMGWNDVAPRDGACLFAGLESGARFYFLHSYYFAPVHPDVILATTDYHGPFASAVRSGNVFGTQFHPEKSHQWGIQL